MDSIKLHDHVLIELNDGDCFVGVLTFVNSAGTKFELNGVRNWRTDEPFLGEQIFYRKDVRTVRQLPSDDAAAAALTPPSSPPARTADSALPTTTRSTVSNANNNDQSSSSIIIPTDEPFISSSNTVLQLPNATQPASRLTVDELQRIRTSIANASYYPLKDRGFYAAVEALRAQETVALSIGHVFRASRSRVGLVSAVTAHDGHVHHFDIVSLGMPAVLRQLLSAQRPLKVVHDSSLAAYALHVQHGVELTGVFDTRLAHIAIGGKTTVTDLGATAELYLHIPAVSCGNSSSSSSGSGTGSSDIIDWTVRPLSAALRQLAGQRVAYLPALYGNLLYERLLDGFLGSCRRFAHVYTIGKDDIDVACQVHQNGGVEPVDGADLRQRMPATVPMGVLMPSLPRLAELPMLPDEVAESC